MRIFEPRILGQAENNQGLIFPGQRHLGRQALCTHCGTSHCTLQIYCPVVITSLLCAWSNGYWVSATIMPKASTIHLQVIVDINRNGQTLRSGLNNALTLQKAQMTLFNLAGEENWSMWSVHSGFSVRNQPAADSSRRFSSVRAGQRIVGWVQLCTCVAWRVCFHYWLLGL